MQFNKETFEKALKAHKIIRYQQHFEAVIQSYLEIENQSKAENLPDHYAGKLNTERIKAYLLLYEQYKVEESTVRSGIFSSTVREIFCSGADWYKKQCQKVNKK